MQEFNIGISVNLPRLIETCMLSQASRGGGKSHLIRRLNEVFSGHIQQIVIDLEGEFVTLRESFNFAHLAVEGGDIPLNIRHASTYAQKFLEAQLSVIIDLSDLKPHNREIFVRDFLHALMHLPKHLYHPLLLYIDEGHKFCPQDESALSTQEVIDVAARGRKRDIGLIVADQRVSKLHKDLTAELLNKVIGRTGQDIDQARAGKELDWKASQYKDLRNLNPGEFYCFGPAFQEDVKKFKVDPVMTTHKRMGSGSVAPPTPKAIKSLISALQDLPEEAEKELETKEQLQAEVSRLSAELKKAKASPAVAFDNDALVKAQADIASKANTIVEQKKYIAHLQSALGKITRITDSLEIIASNDLPPIGRGLFISENLATVKKGEAHKAPVPNATTSSSVQSGPLRYLKAAATFYPEPISKKRMCAMAGTSFKSSTHRAYMAKLKQDGLLDVIDPDTFKATAKGIKMAGDIEPLPAPGQEMVDMWCAKLGKGPAAYLQKLASVYPRHIRKEDLAKACGTEYTKSTHRAYMAELNACQLVEVLSDAVKAADELFA